MTREAWILSGSLVPILLGLAGCRPPRPALPEAPPVALRLQPEAVTLTAGHEFRFGYHITSGQGLGVDWRVPEPGGGTLDAQGHYRAPDHVGVYTVEARPQADPARAARAKVTVVPAPRGDISAPPAVAPEATDLRAGVPVQPGCRFAWNLRGGTLLAGADTDTVTFSAGPGPKLILGCRVTNPAGDAITSSLEIPVTRPLSISIGPARATLTVGRTMKFGYTLEGNGGPGVTWSLIPPDAGTVDAVGTYRAPATPGLYTLQVAATAHPDATAQARVKVVAAPEAAITAPESVLAGAVGLAARVPAQAGATYVWEIQGGTATAGQHGPVLTFTAGDGPLLTLRCTVTNEAGDAYTRSVQVDVKR